MLGKAFNELPPGVQGVHGCFFDEGAELAAIFKYGTEPDVPVEVHLSGCEEAWNGEYKVAKSAYSIAPRLEALTPHHRR